MICCVIIGCDHSNNELSIVVIGCFRYFYVRYSDPHCRGYSDHEDMFDHGMVRYLSAR